MIVNLSALSTLQSEWQGVIRMRERIRHLVSSTFAFDAIKSPIFGDVLYNLPLVLAFNVLTQVLLLVRDERRYADSQPQLGDLMDSARASLPWIDWECLREGVKRRNEVAHGGKLFGDMQCLHYIGDIEAQLVAWDVIAVAKLQLAASH